MSTLVYHISVLLCALLADVPVGTNLSSLQKVLSQITG